MSQIESDGMLSLHDITGFKRREVRCSCCNHITYIPYTDDDSEYHREQNESLKKMIKALQKELAKKKSVEVASEEPAKEPDYGSQMVPTMPRAGDPITVDSIRDLVQNEMRTARSRDEAQTIAYRRYIEQQQRQQQLQATATAAQVLAQHPSLASNFDSRLLGNMARQLGI